MKLTLFCFVTSLGVSLWKEGTDRVNLHDWYLLNSACLWQSDGSDLASQNPLDGLWLGPYTAQMRNSQSLVQSRCRSGAQKASQAA